LYSFYFPCFLKRFSFYTTIIVYFDEDVNPFWNNN
jgi:hypothetical protein